MKDLFRVLAAGLTWADRAYQMLVQNPLILTFVIMCVLFLGIALLKKLMNS